MGSGILLWIGELGNIKGKKRIVVSEKWLHLDIVFVWVVNVEVGMWEVNMWVNVWVIVLIFLDALACLLITYSSGTI